jgi:NAD(P)-dependent dehydrogenase (short-subunit alcohol dehydrogenase family)
VQIKDAVAVVTGGASGIGAALCRRFAAEGARTVVVVDRDADAAQAVAGGIGGVAERVDVTEPAAVRDLVERTLAREGTIDVFCSNAGITTGAGVEADPDDLWHRAYEVNVWHTSTRRAPCCRRCSRAAGAGC